MSDATSLAEASRFTRRAARQAAAGIGRPGLAAVSLSGADGVGYVARLLQRAMTDLAGVAPWTVTLDPASSAGVRLAERLRFSARVVSGQARHRADWVLYNHVGIARTQRLVPRRLRLPYAVMLHGIEVWGPALDAGRRDVLRRATLRLANSHYTAARVMDEHPEIGEVIGCPLALLPPATPAGEIDSELLARVSPKAVLITGRMSRTERYKGHDELIDAWPAMRRHQPDAQLVIVGRGDDLERLRVKATTLGLGDAVLFTGFVSEATLEALYARAALFAMPSRGEGFGLVYLDAMRHALPVVASVHDAAGDIVEHERTGLLVDQHDRAALVAALVALLRDSARARALGEAGRRRYEAEFTYAAFRDRLGAVLARTFGHSGAA